MHQKIGYIIQARLGSKRLPAKALLYYGGTTILNYIIKSLVENGVKKELVCVATSTSVIDDVIENYVTQLGYKVIRGDEDNVFRRFQTAAKETGFENMVRLTGDNPLINTNLVAHCVKKHIEAKAKLTSTREVNGTKIKRYVPKGFSVDVINSLELLSVNSADLTAFEAEHVIPYFYNNFEVQLIKDFKIQNTESSIDTLADYVTLFK